MGVNVAEAFRLAQAKAVNQVVAEVKVRIQNLGQTSLNKSIGTYSTGYKSKRSSKGYQTDHIDLTVTGELLASYKAGKGLQNQVIVCGFDSYNTRTTTTKEGKTYTVSLTDIYTEKERWTKNGDIFQWSESEIETYNQIVQREFQLEINKQRGK